MADVLHPGPTKAIGRMIRAQSRPASLRMSFMNDFMLMPGDLLTCETSLLPDRGCLSLSDDVLDAGDMAGSGGRKFNKTLGKV